MTIDPLYAFVFAGLFSPGPNVIMLIASGVRFGFVPTVPHILGVAAGVGVTAGLTGLGLAELLRAVPALQLTLQIAAALWILSLAWKLFKSSRMGQADPDAKPFRFWQAVLFQWVNPKVWAVALSAAAGFPGGGSPTEEALRLGMAFAGINLFVCLFWTFAGHSLTVVLQKQAVWRGFMTFMAAALALSAGLIFA